MAERLADERSAQIAALTDTNLKLARFLAVLCQGQGVDYDDLESEACLALWAAARNFDPASHPGVAFGSYARHRITRALTDLVADARASHLGGLTVRERRRARRHHDAMGLPDVIVDTEFVEGLADETLADETSD